MAKRRQPDGFDLLLADHQNISHNFEEADESHHLWSELSAEGKLAYLAGDAALYDVPFERFRAAAPRPGPSRAEERPAAEASLVQQLAASMRERKVRLADYVIYDTSEAVLSSLDAFGDEFERLR